MKLSKVFVYMFFVASSIGAQEIPSTSDSPRVHITTTLGSFVIELNPNRAPFTVESFLQYAEEGHYEGTIFHRVIPGFLAQAGGYTEDLQVKLRERSVVNESGNGLSNLRGTIGLARTNDPHSGNAQFYINLDDNLDLNPRPTRWGYAVFGTVVEGMEVVDEIGHRPTGPQGHLARDVPTTAIVIEQVEILTQ
ncbi:MAG: peptidylprolyl isomerase [Candidatus Rariloculaceae bacterium]|tara:strand:+ start:171 stop:749 length:579 start_codon:yes stop_codon:yes gene_type:complete